MLQRYTLRQQIQTYFVSLVFQKTEKQLNHKWCLDYWYQKEDTRFLILFTMEANMRDLP